MKKVMKFGLKALTGKALHLFDLNLSMKPVKKFLVYKCKLSVGLLHLAEMFINKLKIQKEFITFFKEISPQ